MLENQNVLRAIQHLDAVGDTDLFPKLPEMGFFIANSERVAELVSKLSVGNYNPVSSVEVLTPKSNLGFRIGHQLTATDILIYTASCIECAAGIQELRDKTSEDIPFSYKYDPDGGARLFEKNRGFHDWLAHLANFGDDDVFDDPKPVLETDISDFYQRIYFHRIENILNDVNASRGSNGAIRKVIQVCRSKQSFGLSEWVKPALLIAGACLPADEYRNWIDIAVRQLGDPFAQDFGVWLKQGQDYEALMAV